MEYRNPDISPQSAEKLSSIERQFIFMRAEGGTIRDIAKKMKKSTHTVCEMNKKFSKQIFNIRNAQFSDLQKKVIDLKNIRLNFLKTELEKITKVLQKNNYKIGDPVWKYNDSISIFIRLSELMSTCEYDMLSVGTNFKENLQPESNDLLENDIDVYDNNISDVAETSNNVAENSDVETAVHNELKGDEQQMTTNNNIIQQKKTDNKSP
ncbi:MAG: hypothetical protein NTU73_03295 [Ignavibacteriae bacterium]|nr:hypothetical protein [Ignavibacteriota bacterium]